MAAATVAANGADNETSSRHLSTTTVLTGLTAVQMQSAGPVVLDRDAPEGPPDGRTFLYMTADKIKANGWNPLVADGGFLIPPRGQTQCSPGCMVGVPQNRALSPVHFGWTPSSSPSETARAFQNAISAAIRNGLNTFCPPSQTPYVIDKPLYIPSADYGKSALQGTSYTFYSDGFPNPAIWAGARQACRIVNSAGGTVLVDGVMYGTSPSGGWDIRGISFEGNTTPQVWSGVTFSKTSPAELTFPGGAPANGTPVTFSADGKLPAPLLATTVYYVVNAAGNTANISRYPGGVTYPGPKPALLQLTAPGGGAFTVRWGKPIVQSNEFSGWRTMSEVYVVQNGTGDGVLLGNAGGATLRDFNIGGKGGSAVGSIRSGTGLVVGSTNNIGLLQLEHGSIRGFYTGAAIGDGTGAPDGWKIDGVEFANANVGLSIRAKVNNLDVRPYFENVDTTGIVNCGNSTHIHDGKFSIDAVVYIDNTCAASRNAVIERNTFSNVHGALHADTTYVDVGAPGMEQVGCVTVRDNDMLYYAEASGHALRGLRIRGVNPCIHASPNSFTPADWTLGGTKPNKTVDDSSTINGIWGSKTYAGPSQSGNITVYGNGAFAPAVSSHPLTQNDVSNKPSGGSLIIPPGTHADIIDFAPTANVEVRRIVPPDALHHVYTFRVANEHAIFSPNSPWMKLRDGAAFSCAAGHQGMISGIIMNDPSGYPTQVFYEVGRVCY
jgi:hypothetical protein